VVADSLGYTFIDTTGVMMATKASQRYTEARQFTEGCAAVKQGGEEEGAWGFVNREGEQIIPSLFPAILGGFSEGMAAVCVGVESAYRVGYIDSSGGFALDSLYDAGGNFSEGLAAVGTGQRRRQGFKGKWGYVDVTGKICIPQRYAWAGPFTNGRALVRSAKSGWSVIDREGRTLQAFPKQIKILPHLSSTQIAFRSGKRIGFLDVNGREIIRPRYLEAGRFRSGLAPVKPDNGSGLWAYINEQGKYLDRTDRVQP
jgi:hypothetical protein